MALQTDPATGLIIEDGKVHADLQTLISGEDQVNNVQVVEQGRFTYEEVGSSASAQTLGTSGAAGDYLHSIIQGVSSNSITLIDGSTSLIVFPATAVCVVWEINAVCTTAWKITTGASTYCMCVGRFT